jgi:type II secretion system protein N
MKIDWTEWKPRIAYGGFAALCFVLALRWTFPAEAVKERVIIEAGSRGWQIDIESVSPGGVLGVRAEGVRLDGHSGLAIPIDEVTASLRLLPLLAGRRSVAFDARLYDGAVRGTADLSGDLRRFVAAIAGVDLAAALPLRKASGVDLVGRLHGSADLTIPAAAREKVSGRVDLQVKEAGVSGGQLPVPGMSSGLPLPRMGFGELVAAVRLADGRATFDKLEARGGDAELQTEGLYFLVQPRLESGPVFGRAKLKVHEGFWTKSGTQGFKGLADVALASAKDGDGAWSFQVTGSVGQPRVLPQTR